MQSQFQNSFFFGQDMQKAEEKRDIRKIANRCGFAMLILLAAMYLFSFLVGPLVYSYQKAYPSLDPAIWNAIYSLAVNIFVYLIITPLILLFLNRMSGTQAAEYLRFPKLPGKTVAKMVLMGIGVVYMASFVSNIVFNVLNIFLSMFDLPMEVQNTSVSPDIVSITVFVIGVAVLPSFFEELLTRCGMVGSIRAYGGLFTALTTGILFGFMHTTFQQVFFAAMMGIYAGFLAYYTRSVWPAILLHISINGIAVIQVLLMTFGNYNEVMQSVINDQPLFFEPSVGSIISILLLFLVSCAYIVLGIIGIVTLVKTVKKHPGFWKEPNLKGACLTLREKCTAFFTSPGVVIFLIVSILLSLFNAYSYLWTV